MFGNTNVIYFSSWILNINLYLYIGIRDMQKMSIQTHLKLKILRHFLNWFFKIKMVFSFTFIYIEVKKLLYKTCFFKMHCSKDIRVD